jgi:hypothetical protein
MPVTDYLIAFGAIMGIATLCSMMHSKGEVEFSGGVFLITIAISIALLIWIAILPTYMIIVSVLIIVGTMLGGSEIGASNE